jgi:glycine cleavage system aminomethyltransferase T
VSPETFTFYVQPWYRKSPYYEATKRYGCQSWGLYNHMLLPTLYDDPVTEYRALLEDVTVWDVSVERCVEITGPDAFELTNLITCRDLTKVAVMQARYVLLTTHWGGIVNDPVLLRLAEDRFWLALADSDALLFVAGVAAGRGMDVEIREADVAPMQIQGPRSRELIRELLGNAVADLRYYFCAEAEVDGIPLVVSRTGWTGEVGFELYLRDASRGDDLFERVMEAGQPYGARVIAPSEARRIEAGIFNYGSDMRVDDTPFHIAGLEKYVELDQEQDFIGKAALAKLAEDGVDRKLVGVDIGGAPMTDEGALNDFWPVREADGSTRIGRVTAGAWSPRLERNVGYAWVPATYMEPGTELAVDSSAGERPATVVALPFVDPEKKIPAAFHVSERS